MLAIGAEAKDIALLTFVGIYWGSAGGNGLLGMEAVKHKSSSLQPSSRAWVFITIQSMPKSYTFCTFTVCCDLN